MKRATAIAVIWFLFLIGSVVAALAFPLVALAGVASERERSRAGHIHRAMNKLTAALIFADGTRSVSAQCGTKRCSFCQKLCPVLAWALEHPKHCEEEAAS